MKENKLFKRLVIFAIAALMLLSVAGTVQAAYVEIGTGTDDQSRVPFNGCYNYGWSATIYLASDIGGSRNINAITYDIDPDDDPYTIYNQKVYMTHTTLSEFSSSTVNRPDESTMTLVYDGDITFSGSGFNTDIVLDTIFPYDGIDNLMIYWENWDGDYDCDNPDFVSTDTYSPTYFAAYRYSDSSNPHELPTGYREDERPNIRLHYSVGNDVGAIAINSPTGVYSNSDSPIPVEVLVGNFGTNDQTDVPVNCRIQEIVSGGVKLDEGFEGIFPPDGWKLESYGDVDEPWRKTPMSPHNGSYSAMGDYGSSGYYTDEWLITPELDLSDDGYTFVFYRKFRSGSASYPDWFSVLISDNHFVTYDTLQYLDYNDPTDPDFVKVSIDLTGYTGTSTEIAFRYESIYGSHSYVDDVLVTKPLVIATVYDEDTLVDVDAGDTVIATFPDWTVSVLENTAYVVEACTGLTSDADNPNDCCGTTATVLFEVHDVGVQSIDRPTLPVMPGLPFEPKVTVENVGSPDSKTFYTELWVTEYLRMYESWENPLLTSGSDESEPVEANFEIHYDKPEEAGKGVIRYPITVDQDPQEPPLGEFGDWYSWEPYYGWGYGDGTSWQPTNSVWWSPDTSIFAKSSPYEKCYDSIDSPLINIGTDFEGIMEVYFYYDFVDGNDDYLTIWQYHPVSGYLGYMYGVGGPGWYYAEFPISSDLADASGNTWIRFQHRTDWDGVCGTVWVDDIQIIGESIMYDEFVETVDLVPGTDVQLTFPEFTPTQGTSYDFNARTLLTVDDDRSNDYMHVRGFEIGRVLNVDQDKWYMDIQPAIDEANPGDSILVFDGDYYEDIIVNVEDLTISAVNPPTSTSIIYGTVDIIADGVTFENFKVIPGGLYTADEAGISIAANDILVQNNIIEGMTGEVADTMFTIKGIHVYGGGPDAFENIVIQNNIVRNIVNTNQTGGGGGCDYEICLTDSYGDGWNGGYLDIYVNGAPVHMGLTVPSGPGPVCEFIPVADGDAIFLDYTYGGWAYENYWELKDNDGIVVFSTWGGSSDTAYDHTETASGCPPPAVISTYGGADGIMIQGYLDGVEVLDNEVYDIHSAGWCYGVEVTPTAACPSFGTPVTYFDEDFSGSFPPSGWSASSPEPHQDSSDSYIPGSWTVPVCDFDWSYLNSGDYIMTDTYDTSGCESLDLYFKSYIFHYSSSYSYSCIVEIYDGSWHDITPWTNPITGDVGPIESSIDVLAYKSSDTQVRFKFTGDSMGTWDWFIDDAKLSGEEEDSVPAGPTPQNVNVIGNYFTQIGDGSVYGVWDNQMIAPYPGIMFTVDELYPGADDGDATAIELHENIFDNDCSIPILAVVNKDTDGILNAEMNYWGNILGPGSYGGPVYDALTGDLADADDFSCSIVNWGPVHFTPFVGINAVATASSLSVETGETVVFNAAGSFAADFDGAYTPVYYWSFGDGFHSNEEQIGHSYGSPGTYDVSVRVRGQGLGPIYSNFMFDWAYLTITVTSPGAPLDANADGGNLGGYETVVGEEVQLFGSASGGVPRYTYSWDLDNGRTSNNMNPVTTYESEGIYTVTLTVTDSEGSIATDMAQVNVLARDELIASAGGPYNGVPSTPVFFYSEVIGGTGPFTYTWDLGDGTVSGLVSPMHAYDEAGAYTVTLTVEDSLGEIDTDTTIVTVEADEDEAIIGEIQGGLGVKATITAGSEPVDWTINVDGRVFMGGVASGSVSAHATETVGIPFSLGIGSVDITLTANSITKECTAFMIGPFVLVK